MKGALKGEDVGEGDEELGRRKKGVFVYKWVKRDICFFLVCVKATWGQGRLDKSVREDALCACFNLFRSLKTKPRSM